jgi:hypothetical protein
MVITRTPIEPKDSLPERHFDAMDVGEVTKIDQRPPRRSRFVLDVHPGKLAHHLRMFGFDALYRNDARPEELVAIARREDRILLSKGARLVETEGLPAAYRLHSSDPREQILEVLRRFDLGRLVRPYSRCLHERCLEPLNPARSSVASN